MAGLSSPLESAMDRSGGGQKTPWAQAAVPWRALIAAALLSLLVGTALARGLAGEHASSAAGVGVTPRSGLSSLPLAARSTVSAAVGAVSRAYGVSATADGFQAASPAQRLRTRFDRSGVLLSAGGVRVGLSLRAIGFGTSLTALGDVTPRARDNRVSYTRAGLDEWYANGPLGLEQGFTIARAPSAGAARALTLSMALSGDAHSSLSPGGRGVIFSHGSSVLRYTALTATDATGRTLHSWLELHAGHLQVRVDTRGARYPLVIDPLIQQDPKLTAAEASSGLVGFSVALSADGNTALVGAPRNNSFAGVALVFTREVTPTGSKWTQQAELAGVEPGGGSTEECVEEPGQEETGCGFGGSVALSADGNTALIGGSRDNGYAGAAWVFTRSGSTWTQGSMLTGSGESGNGRFGRSVALSADGNTALIGGPCDGGCAGAAWVFTRGEGSTWTQQGSKLTSGEGENGVHYFARSVALSTDGNTALIGEPCASGCTGAAWVFTRAGSTWTGPTSKLTGGGEEIGEGRFGFSVALSSDASTAVIGARSDNEGAGAAWVFAREGSSWSHEGNALTGGGEASPQAKFGYSVALSAAGDTALIGGPGDSNHRGAAWLFTRSGAAWTAQVGKLTGEGEIGPGSFGDSAALSSEGDTALIGGPDDHGKLGAAWVFAPGPTVEEVNPTEGPATGGTPVTITGTSFTAASTVDFVGKTSVPATSITFNSPTSITAISPAGKGKVDVHVTTPAVGTSPVSPGDEFTYISTAKNPVHPTVTGISPSSGSAAGGTTVTITGTGFAEASAVEFGSTQATYTIKSATEITAVSPAGTAGETVDVKVRAPGGLSLRSERDLFTFRTPGGSPNPLTSASGGSSGGASGGVLSFGPFVVSSCTIALRGKTIAVQSYKRAAVKLSWAGVGVCKGTLKLTVKTKSGHAKGGHQRYKTNTIGTGTFSIAPGSVRTVGVNLNALGRSLLKARHGRLNASLAITKLSPGPAQARAASVRLTLQKPHKAKKPKK